MFITHFILFAVSVTSNSLNTSNTSCTENTDNPNNTTEEIGIVVGIDLGTTFSRVGVFRRHGFEIIPNEIGHRTTPSIVSFTEGKPLVGDSAVPQLVLNPRNTILAVRRLIGRRFDDAEVQDEIGGLPYRVINVSGRAYIEVESRGELKRISPEQVSALILGTLKTIAEDYLGQRVRKAERFGAAEGYHQFLRLRIYEGEKPRTRVGLHAEC
jgi:heat shock protein 5